MATGIPGFRAGETLAICVAQSPTTTGATSITVGQLPAQVGLATPDRILASIPEEPNPGTYTVAGTVRGSTLNQSLSNTTQAPNRP